VYNLSDEELLDFLMTSEFDENFSIDQYRFLLKKFRNFYRVIYCSVSNYKDRMDNSLVEKKMKEEELEIKTKEFDYQTTELINKLNRIRNKKLTFKERILGKIIEGHENN